MVAGKKESKRPYMYDEVTVDYTVSTEDQKVIEQKENACFVVGDGDVIQGNAILNTARLRMVNCYFPLLYLQRLKWLCATWIWAKLLR